MRTYAGIGSRQITEDERQCIDAWAKWLKREYNYVVVSGNADGADIAFQTAANSQCYIMLPWNRFNADHYDPAGSMGHWVLGDERRGNQYVDSLHPAPRGLSRGGRACMARNFYQVAGHGECPQVDFVLCCANENGPGDVWGGTGHAVRVATKLGIPYFNIRTAGWNDRLLQHLHTILAETQE